MVTLAPRVESFPTVPPEHEEPLVAEQGAFQVVNKVVALIPAEYAGTQVSPLPSRIRLGFLRDGRLRLLQPLEVIITKEENQIAAEAEELNEFGYGDSSTEAVADLQRTIAELYFTLDETQGRLGKGLQEVWQTLRAKIVRR